jgi:hypothetical protein
MAKSSVNLDRFLAILHRKRDTDVVIPAADMKLKCVSKVDRD